MKGGGKGESILMVVRIASNDEWLIIFSVARSTIIRGLIPFFFLLAPLAFVRQSREESVRIPSNNNNRKLRSIPSA